MRLAVSNIAWDPQEDDAVAAVLRRHGIDAIDIAPGKYFADPAAAKMPDIEGLRRRWADRGMEITGMQSLLFGRPELNVFGSPAVREMMLRHLGAVCRIAGGLGSTRLVFGSPRNRDAGQLDATAASRSAVGFFRQLGAIAQSEGVLVCLEPNPVCYGANFMTTSDETAEVVMAVDHPSIRMQFDTGAMTINGEAPEAVLAAHAGLIGHVHASEPDLVPLGQGTTDHAGVSDALRRFIPDSLVCIEMLATQHLLHPNSIEQAVESALRSYGGPAAGCAQ